MRGRAAGFQAHCILILGLFVTAASQAAPPPAAPASAAPTKGELMIAPIPFLNPSLEEGLTLVAGWIFSTTPPKPATIIGGGIFYSGNKSMGGGLGYKGYLREDRLRITAGSGLARINYDFFGIGNELAKQDRSIPLQQDAIVLLASTLVRIAPNVHLGPRVAYQRFEITVDGDLNVGPIEIPGPQLDAQTASIGANLEWDTRDGAFSPSHGSLFDARADAYDGAWGSDFDYQAYQAAYNHYIPSGQGHVVALRGYGRLTDGDVPFFALSMFGQNGDLRGFETGKYRDRAMLAGQAEYRRRLSHRWGAVAFAGLGKVAPDAQHLLNAEDLLWSAGAGLRFRITKQNALNFRFDAAYGDGDVSAYFGVGEAF